MTEPMAGALDWVGRAMTAVGVVSFLFACLFFVRPDLAYSLRTTVLWHTGLVAHYVPVTTCQTDATPDAELATIRIGSDPGVFDIGRSRTVGDLMRREGSMVVFSLASRQVYGSVEGIGAETPIDFARQGDLFFIGRIFPRACTGEGYEGQRMFVAEGLFTRR